MSEHPLEGLSLKVQQFKCFGEEPGGFDEIKPINIIIGKNNSGKSGLADLVEFCTKSKDEFKPDHYLRQNQEPTIHVGCELTQEILIQVFRPENSRGGVPGPDHWSYGQRFIGTRVLKKYGRDFQTLSMDGPTFDEVHAGSRTRYIDMVSSRVRWPFENLSYLKVSAERKVGPERRSRENPRFLQSSGDGTTDLVSAFIHRESLPRDEVEIRLLSDLNQIYMGDCEFKRILCQEGENESWEIFLTEESKGDVRLSQSGSSLQSIFIILCMVRLFPQVRQISMEKLVLVVEEPENNLHPSLLRRLLNFLAKIRDEKKFTLFVTTHSPVAIDWAANRDDSQIIHVQHDGENATTSTSTEYLDNRKILEDLDYRASDLLQSNAIIWVEGPSDRIYLRRWLELFSVGEIKEGVHYTTMFYGGKLLNHLDSLPPDENDGLVSLLSINRNAAILIDSDRYPVGKKKKTARMHINASKRRIRDEVKRVNGFIWITDGREIENYTKDAVWAGITDTPAPRISKYDQIPELPIMRSFKKNKINIAHAVVDSIDADDLKGHLDLWERLEELANRIRGWNGLDRPN